MEAPQKKHGSTEARTYVSTEARQQGSTEAWHILSDPPLHVGHGDADYYVIGCCFSFRVDMVSLLIFDFPFSRLDF
jgi:hypothetical protein